MLHRIMVARTTTLGEINDMLPVSQNIFMHKVDYVKQARVNKSKDDYFRPISNITFFAYSYPFSMVSRD